MTIPCGRKDLYRHLMLLNSIVSSSGGVCDSICYLLHCLRSAAGACVADVVIWLNPRSVCKFHAFSDFLQLHLFLHILRTHFCLGYCCILVQICFHQLQVSATPCKDYWTCHSVVKAYSVLLCDYDLGSRL